MSTHGMQELARDRAPVLRSLGMVYAAEWPRPVLALLYGPRDGYAADHTIEDALDVIERESAYAFPSWLLPIAAVDERSFACVVMDDNDRGLAQGVVVRWHLDEIPAEHQLALLDVDPLLYVASVAEEIRARNAGLERLLDEIGPAYAKSHLDKDRRPRDYVIRPVRLACQNVIVGLAAIAQEAAFDGLSVVAWQTCEVPHVAAHEANRALAAITLCDAFQNGGTMEIRFDMDARISVDGVEKRYQGHPEGRVPASLRRYGRTVGIVLGAEDEAAITPAEARELFLAVTPMPAELRSRIAQAVTRDAITPERLCFTLLSQIWREVELDFLLACCARAGSILEGGAPWQDRGARQVEMEGCRAALMAGMLYRRLDGRDAAGDAETRVVEDRRVGVAWSINSELGAIAFSGLDSGRQLPWLAADARSTTAPLVVFPRTIVSRETIAAVNAAAREATVALVLPVDVEAPQGLDALLMRCPERVADLDKAVEAKLLKLRISRS